MDGSIIRLNTTTGGDTCYSKAHAANASDPNDPAATCALNGMLGSTTNSSCTLACRDGEVPVDSADIAAGSCVAVPNSSTATYTSQRTQCYVLHAADNTAKCTAGLALAAWRGGGSARTKQQRHF